MQAGLVACYFVSYVLIVGVVLMNIVVAVLLDEFISTVAREKTAQAAVALKETEVRGSGCGVWGVGCRVQGAGRRVQGSPLEGPTHRNEHHYTPADAGGHILYLICLLYFSIKGGALLCAPSYLAFSK